jgi:outer membrane protein W
MRRVFQAGVMALVLGVVVSPPASAQQAVNFYIGGFAPRAVDARDNNDVLVKDLNFLSFNIKDFNGPTTGGEWLIGFGRNFEGSLGVGFYQRTAPSVYLNFVNANGSEIQQDLKLRVVPFTATVRFLPMGRNNGIEPYIGAGVGILNYRYSESGQFLDNANNIFRGTFVGSGTATGPVILGGVRVPVGSWGFGGEIRYQAAKGDLPADQDFAGSRIDLSGVNYLFTLNVKF